MKLLSPIQVECRMFFDLSLRTRGSCQIPATLEKSMSTQRYILRERPSLSDKAYSSPRKHTPLLDHRLSYSKSQGWLDLKSTSSFAFDNNARSNLV